MTGGKHDSPVGPAAARIVTILLAAVAVDASAAEVDYRLEAGGGNTSNLGRTSTNEDEASFASAGFDLVVQQRGPRFDADVTASLERYEYFATDTDGEVTGYARASGLATIIPGRFRWSLEETFGQTSIDPFTTSSPENRQNINYFTTGPDILFQLGTVTQLTLFGRYSDTNYEVTELDSDSTLGGLTISWPLASAATVSLQGLVESTDFDNELATDYDRASAFLRWSGEGARTRLTTDVGYNEISPDGGDSSGAPLFRLDVTRNLSRNSALQLQLSTEFSGAADSFRNALESPIGQGLDIPGQTTPTDDTFESRQATLSYRFDFGRTSFDLGAGYTNDRYEEDDLFDRKSTRYTVRIGRQIRPTLRGSIYAAQSRDRFGNAAVSDRENGYGLEMTWRMGRRFGLLLNGEHATRSASDPEREFDETRVRLGVTFSPTNSAIGR